MGSDSASPTIKATSVEQPHACSHTYAKHAEARIPKSNADLLKNSSMISSLPTPVKANKLNDHLLGYDDNLRKYLIKGFTSGFSLGCTTTPPASLSKNHSSAINHPQIIQAHIQNSLKLDRISGPFPNPPFDPFVSSPLGVIPKSEPGKFRIIHDLSYPKSNSVNTHIPKENSEVHYDSIDWIINLVQKHGTHCLMAKTDIQDAFRIIPICPDDYHLLGFSWQGQYYFDKCLPMGASSSCQIFEKFSVALQWILQSKYGAGDMSHILDDFFFIGPANSSNCKNDLTNFLYLCKCIGVPIKMSKTQTPTTIITIYGIEIDSDLMEARLPVDKVEKIKKQLVQMLQKEQTTLREFQSLIGLLNFACSVVVPGRAFLRRMIDLTCGITEPTAHIKVTKETKADIQTWLSFVSSFNGKSVFLPQKWLSTDHLTLYTDASGSLGFAAILGQDWFASHWNVLLKDCQIAVKELFPIVLAIELWGNKIKNKRILFMSDNMAVVQIINKQTSKDRTIMKLVRRLVLATLKCNIHFRAKHIPGKHNVTADRLSRFQFQAAFQSAPHLNRQQTPIPQASLTI